MCGITGLIHRDNSPNDLNILENMTQAIRHRGPDADGFYSDGCVGLGHRRLSIIDLSGGAQPMSTADGQLTVVFNGEIYNYLDLKKQLTGNGHTFQTQSDTEVLLYLWQDKGPEMLHDLWGMFSFALYDKSQNKVFMAVDRFGQKPFYYYLGKDVFAFASEPNALKQHPKVPLEMDTAALHHYLSFLAVSPPKSIYKHIGRLAGGRQLIYDLNTHDIEESMWYHLDALNKNKMSFDEAREELKFLLSDATQRRLMSEVPLGSFLSGGIDSAIVSALAQQHSEDSLKTFTIGNEESSWDESSMAAQCAQYLSTDHHSKNVTPVNPDDLIAMIEHMGEPFADSSLIPTSLVCAFARQHVTVALSGDGADEAFSGYDRYRAMALSGYFDFLPSTIRAPLAKGFDAILPSASEERTLMHKAHRFLKMVAENDLSRFHVIGNHFSEEAKQQLYTEDFFESVAHLNSINILETDFARSHGAPMIDRVHHLDINRYLQDDILVKVDRASMKHSLELRSPFMDHRVIEFATSLPHEYKRQGSRGKHILKETFKDLLPPGHTELSKKGFAVPLGRWFRNSMKSMAHDLLTDKTAKERGIFNSAAIDKLLIEHAQGRYDHGQRIWALCAFEAWARSV